MDIIKKVRPLKATYQSISFTGKMIAIIILINLFGIIIPHQTQAQEIKNTTPIVFTVGDYDEYISAWQNESMKNFSHEQTVEMLKKQIRLTEKVRQFLITQNSPLAAHVKTLMQQNNWKKILALSNAESGMCRKYTESTNNCWGVGGSDRWQMGDNLDQALVSMNRFLNTSPLQSDTKYTDMSFDEMNGLYKQPAAQHWVDNNEIIYDQLTQLEQSVQ